MPSTSSKQYSTISSLPDGIRRLKASIKEKYIENDDGSVTFPNVKLLASGTWTDSAIQTPLYYPPATLEHYATNWIDSTLWDRHSVGREPRTDDNAIGKIVNPHFDDDAVVGDVWLHRNNSSSKATAQNIINSIHTDSPIFVSVEHGGEEQEIPGLRMNESKSLVFVGCAVVPVGACKKCRINGDVTMGDDSPDYELKIKELSDALSVKDTEIKELSGIVEDLKVQSKEETDMRIKELEAKIPDVSAFETQIKEFSAKLEEIPKLEKRIKELEAQPDGNHSGGSLLDSYVVEDPYIRDSEGITMKVI